MRAGGDGGNKDEMLGWYHQVNGHEFEQTLEDSKAWHPVGHGATKSLTRLSNLPMNNYLQPYSVQFSSVQSLIRV